MPLPPTQPGPDISTDSMLLIVVGAHLRAEVHDRPLGYRLRDVIRQWNQAQPDAAGGHPLSQAGQLAPVVCTDLWFLNQPDLQERPAIAVGPPGVNAATAHFCNRLPVAFMIEGTLEVRMDLEGRVPAASIWGIDHESTSAAVDAFIARHMEEFLGRGG